MPRARLTQPSSTEIVAAEEKYHTSLPQANEQQTEQVRLSGGSHGTPKVRASASICALQVAPLNQSRHYISLHADTLAECGRSLEWR